MPEIIAAGGTLVVISPQVAAISRNIADKLELTFDILVDRGNRVAAEFGIVFTLPDDLRQLYRKFGIDLVTANGDESWTLPMPARFVIDRGGTIRAADADPDYTRRPEPSRTVEALRGL